MPTTGVTKTGGRITEVLSQAAFSGASVARGEADGYTRVTADLRRMHSLEPRFLDDEVGRRVEYLFERDARLEPCERRSEAGVRARAETQVVTGVAADVVHLRALESALVAVG